MPEERPPRENAVRMAEALQRVSARAAETQQALLTNPKFQRSVSQIAAALTNPRLQRSLAELAVTQQAVLTNPKFQRSVSQIAAALTNPKLQRAVSQQSRSGALLEALQPAPIAPPRAGEPESQPRAPARPRTPWREVAVVLRRGLFGSLIELDAQLIVRLDGAWERVARGGPHSAAQGAHSMIEFVDWCLRTSAPDEAVISWHRQELRPVGEVHEGSPTRSLRMRYLLRDRDPDGPMATVYVRNAQDVLGLLQKIKHTAENVGPEELAALMMSIEATLVFLFGSGPKDWLSKRADL
jgi:hypothetical protein